ncbi:MAG: UbiA prenyltransferase family protein [Myxococcota bacterium]|nr:UbiA prenyltransferase family protein [Myxococcota bacterium]
MDTTLPEAEGQPRSRGPLSRIWPYVQIARPDHWFKNTFMLLGVFVALFVEPSSFQWAGIPLLLLGFLSTCITASSNYVINEVLDAASDRQHPVKKHRPAASWAIKRSIAMVEWIGLGMLGIAIGWLVHPYFALAALSLWIMGVIYNVPPVRSKEIPYLDVLSESINNPIRLVLGWFVFIQDRFPPVSLILAYWMVGAFFMAMKRFAEYREIGDPKVAALYRKSFDHYDEERLLISLFFYAIAGALFSGVFIVRYHLELIFLIPLLAGFFAWYMKLGLQPGSPVQNPEKLYKERGFVLYAGITVVVGGLLMFTHVPLLYEMFNIEWVSTPPLWVLDGK